ncbi:hypothetical protein D3C71_1163150 [compost metagenome]
MLYVKGQIAARNSPSALKCATDGTRDRSGNDKANGDGETERNQYPQAKHPVSLVVSIFSRFPSLNALPFIGREDQLQFIVDLDVGRLDLALESTHR